MKFIGNEDGMNIFHFVCEGCHCEGELKMDEKQQAVQCPEGCGAMYIQWQNPIIDKPDLQCVVCPVFGGEYDSKSLQKKVVS